MQGNGKNKQKLNEPVDREFDIPFYYDRGYCQ
jgi:hypothetical protein